jgi:hypothetical protein
LIGDVLFYFFVEFLLNVVCYGAGAIALVLVTAGRLKPGRKEHETITETIKKEGETTYTLDGVRYVYPRWVILYGVGVWLVVILATIAVHIVRSI